MTPETIAAVAVIAAGVLSHMRLRERFAQLQGQFDALTLIIKHVIDKDLAS